MKFFKTKTYIEKTILIDKDSNKDSYLEKIIEFDERFKGILKVGGIDKNFYFKSRERFALGVYG